MRRMIFATVHSGRWVHYLECAHLSKSPRAAGVSGIALQAWDRAGRLAVRDTVPLDETLWRLDLPRDPMETYFVTLESEFRAQMPHVYGYVHSGGARGLGAAVYYPLNMALGSHHDDVWDNAGHFVWGTRLSRHGMRFFVGNPSRWAIVEGFLTLIFEKRGPERTAIRLEPKHHRLIELWPDPGVHEDELPVALEFVSSSKLVTYVLGVERETGNLTFIDHLMERHR